MRSFGLLLLAVLTACESAGPAFIERDQIGYGSALLEAEKRQLLLNIVRLRYGDIPAVVRIDQIVAGYERRVLGSVGSTFASDFALTDDFAVRAEGSLADRPTFTIRPLQGADYARFMLRPIPPREVVGLIASGAHLFTAMGLTVERINGVPNNELLAGPEPPTGRFWRVVALMQELRNDGLVQIAFEPDPDRDTERVYISFIDLPEAAPDPRAVALIELLGLDPDRDRFEVVLGVAPGDGGQIALWTRSLIEILSDIAFTIDGADATAATPRLVGQRRTGADGAADGGSDVGIDIRVRGGPLPPDDGFARVRYDGRWYWIEDEDVWTKRAFSMLLLITTILEREDRGAGAVLTIPAN